MIRYEAILQCDECGKEETVLIKGGMYVELSDPWRWVIDYGEPKLLVCSRHCELHVLMRRCRTYLDELIQEHQKLEQAEQPVWTMPDVWMDGEP